MPRACRRSTMRSTVTLSGTLCLLEQDKSIGTAQPRAPVVTHCRKAHCNGRCGPHHLRLLQRQQQALRPRHLRRAQIEPQGKDMPIIWRSCASVTRRRAARLRPIALRLLNPLDGRLRSTGTCSTPAPRCTRPSFTATCKLLRGRVARTRQRAETIISSACPTHFPRSTTAVLLAAALTFPPLASIAKATDANVMPLISTAFHLQPGPRAFWPFHRVHVNPAPLP